MDVTKLIPVDEPQKMEIIDPTTGHPVEDPRGAPYILLYGEDSAVYRKRQREIANRQIKATERMRRFDMGSAEQTERDRIDTAVACTAGWEFIEWDGAPLEFSLENARKLYSVNWILEQVTTFILDRSNFTRPSSKDSANEPGGSSTSRGRLKAVAGSPSGSTSTG